MDNGNSYSKSPLLRSRLTEQIADHIQEIITQNRLEPGTRLPSGGKLAAMFHVSQATVSEAIRLVEERGLVQRVVGSGTYVTDKARTAFIESMQRLFIQSSSKPEDLMTFRRIFEPNIASIAARRASSDDIIALYDIIAEVEKAYNEGNIAGQLVADAKFHEALARATHNELLIAVSVGALQVLLSTRDLQFKYPGHPESIASHRLIYDAITDHDSERAKQAMEYHLSLTLPKE